MNKPPATTDEETAILDWIIKTNSDQPGYDLASAQAAWDSLTISERERVADEVFKD